jgi:Ca-activated chloride channel family protein
MECDFLTLKPIEANTSLIPCALRLKAPDTVDRIPTHIILLLDVSESMMTDNKLENVKVCSELILNFLTDQDHVSLITFGEKATLHLKRVVADSLHKDSIKNVIKNLYCDGCTNLSAGLGYVREVCAGETQKTGLLILTDGHANRGIHIPEDLRNLVKSIKSSNTNLSIHCVAYGTDHNSDLIKSVAEDKSTLAPSSVI